MPIDFTPDRWDAIRENYRRWWAGDLDRPLFWLTMSGVDPGRPEPELPGVSFPSFYGLDTPAEAIVDRWDWDLSQNKYLADGFPSIWPNFGAGVLGAFTGARLYNTPETDTVWFDIPEDWNGEFREIEDIDIMLDLDNVWLKRVAELMRTGVERWEGGVQIAMTDLGGNLDVLSTYRPSEKLLLDLIDKPDQVNRLTWQEHDAWWAAFDYLNGILQPVNPGYTAWAPIYSEVPYYMLQCDFCYMIGPEMFDEFVKPELAASCKRLGNAFYHLDGPGELPHLDSLLTIPELTGVQWVPGSGSPDIDQWPEVYQKIREAGKLTQIWNGRGQDGRFYIDIISEQVGSAEGIVVMGAADAADESEVTKMLGRYGAI